MKLFQALTILKVKNFKSYKNGNILKHFNVLKVLKVFRTLDISNVSNVSNVSQRAALAAVSGDLDAVEAMREAFDRRRKLMWSMFSEIRGVSLMEPQGAFYAFPNFKEIIGTEVAGIQVESTAELAQILLEEIHVAVVPGEAFGAPGYARLSFALSDEDLVEGVERIANLLGG